MLLELSDEFGFHVQTLQHGLEGYKIASEIAKHGVGLSTFADEWGYKIEAYDAIPYNTAILMRHGVVATVNSDDDGRARRLNIEGAKMMRWGGLTEDEALKTVTYNGAVQLGIDKRVGSIEQGKDADVVIWTGNPLSVYSRVETTLIDGEIFFDRQKDLAMHAAMDKERAESRREGRCRRRVAAVDVAARRVAGRRTRRRIADMRRFIQSFVLGAAVTALPAALSAQFGFNNPRPGPQGTFIIKGGHIVTVSGADIPNGSVVISGGKITAVGANVTAPSGATVIDATGMHVFPGMIETGSSIGLAEITEGANATVDNAEVGRFNPNVQAFFGFDPHSAELGVTRVVGITSVVTSPSGGLIAGSAALMDLAGDTPPQMAVVPRVAMVIQLPGGGRGGRGGGGAGAAAAPATGTTGGRTPLDSIKNMLRDADAYGKAQDAYAKDKTLPRPPHDVVLAALVPVVRGQMPVIFPADAQAEIREAVAFAQEMKLKPIIMGGRDAWRMTDFLKQFDVPVIIRSVQSLPSREDDPYDANYAAPAKLAAAGVRFAIAAGTENPDIRNLPFVAGMAAAFGLSKEDALKSVTLWPAQIFGVGDKLGSIEVGKMANIVIADGDMLEARTNVKHLFIEGREVPLDTKHTELYKAFKDRP